jgi:hypothetical protein
MVTPFVLLPFVWHKPPSFVRLSFAPPLLYSQAARYRCTASATRSYLTHCIRFPCTCSRLFFHAHSANVQQSEDLKQKSNHQADILNHFRQDKANSQPAQGQALRVFEEKFINN